MDNKKRKIISKNEHPAVISDHLLNRRIAKLCYRSRNDVIYTVPTVFSQLAIMVIQCRLELFVMW